MGWTFADKCDEESEAYLDFCIWYVKTYFEPKFAKEIKVYARHGASETKPIVIATINSMPACKLICKTYTLAKLKVNIS